jgi:hypothetical protein
MELTDLIKNFEEAKNNIEPIARDRKMVFSIFRIENEESGRFIGDGFFYASPDKISYKCGMMGYDSSATPENLLEAYREYKDNNIKMEDALIDATSRLDDWYKEFA